MNKIFNINITDESREEVKKLLEQFLGSYDSHHIVTINPEMLVAARKNREFHQILQEADITVADGFGLQLVTGGKIKNRITGNDILKILLSLAYSHQKKIYFLGGAGDQAHQAMKKVQTHLPNLKIRADAGGLISKKGRWFIHPSVLEQINKFQPDMLVVGLGHQKQELFIHDFLPELPSVKIAVGVGGVFAFLSGQIKRAPKIFQKLGLEWLWRLIKEPQRFGRIFTAVIIFPILYFYDKLINRDI